jgi:hypothetical protein
MRLDAVLYTGVFLAGAEALAYPRSNSGSFIHLVTERQQIPASALRRRAGSSGAVSSDLKNIKSGYIIQAKVGTPPQNIGLLLDTGSSDFFVPSSEATFHPDASDKGFREAQC